MTVQHCRVDGVDIEYTDTGSGPIVLFVHGIYVTGALWDDVIAALGTDFRCIAPTWPLGAHDTTIAGADLGAEAAARRIVHFVETLDLREVTVVANDTGGGLVLTSLGDTTLDTSRITRLVLTNCDSYEHFPPGSFAQIVKLCRLSSTLGGAVLRLLATGPGQSFFLKAVCKQPPLGTAATRNLRRLCFQRSRPPRRRRGDRFAGSGAHLGRGISDRGIRQAGHAGLGHRRRTVPPRPRPATARRISPGHPHGGPGQLHLRHARCASPARRGDPHPVTGDLGRGHLRPVRSFHVTANSAFNSPFRAKRTPDKLRRLSTLGELG